MVVNEVYPDLQSSYRQHHSTETALLKVMNDVLLKMNSQHVTLMILLDLSAAFDTVDHNILLERLRRDVGIRGKVLDWFSSYLLNRSQQFSIDGSLSRQFPLHCGVPQGSCLGPLLFVIYLPRCLRLSSVTSRKFTVSRTTHSCTSVSEQTRITHKMWRYVLWRSVYVTYGTG